MLQLLLELQIPITLITLILIVKFIPIEEDKENAP